MKEILISLVLMIASRTWGDVATNNVSEMWRKEFMWRENSVRAVNWGFVPDVRICGGLPKGEAILAALMTAIHHDAVGKRSVTGRLEYMGLTFSLGQIFQRAEWVKGEPLKEQEKEALSRIYRRYNDTSRGGWFFQPPKGGTMFTGQALMMKRTVFGWRFNIAGGVKSLAEKNGWLMDVEMMEEPDADWLRRAMNKHAVPILESRNKNWGSGQVVLMLGSVSTTNGEYFTGVDPMVCGLGLEPRFERYGGAQYGNEAWGVILAPPGSGGWNALMNDKGNMGPSDLQVKLHADLPAGCSVEPYKTGDWKATVVKEMRPDWKFWNEEIERITVTNKPEKPLVSVGSVLKDAALWADHFMGRETFAVSSACDLINNIRCCPMGEGVSPFAAALAMAVFRSAPQGVRLVETGHDKRRVIQYTCEERLRIMPEVDKKVLMAKFREINSYMAGSDADDEYRHGDRLWTVDEEGTRKFWSLFAEATNGVVMGPIQEVPGRTRYQQAVVRLSPLDETGDPVLAAMKRIADRYGWSAEVEKVELPTFGMIKKSVEMEVPVLVRKPGNRGWLVVAGFLSERGTNALLVVDPELVREESKVESASFEEHDERLALSPWIPGRVKYEKDAAVSKFRTDRLLDTRRELPPGCRFVVMDGLTLGTAYFIHDWHPKVCFKDRLDALLRQNKVGDIPPPPHGLKTWNSRWEVQRQLELEYYKAHGIDPAGR